MKKSFIILLCFVNLSRAELPHPELLPTTKAIHAKLEKTTADPKKMDIYQAKVALAKNATYEMLPIQGGTFTIGSPETEATRKADEGPQKTIAIDPFWMGKYEITWNLYSPFMENGGNRNRDGTLNRDTDQATSDAPEINDGETLVDTVTQPTPPWIPMNFGMGDGSNKDYPAVGVTQHAASKFCEWLSAQTGHFYRLPTEAEWEYACRAGTTTAYSFGDDISKIDDYAWHLGNSSGSYQKVGTKKANPWGLYDMHGNVSEHVLDQYLAAAYANTKNGEGNPWTPATQRFPTSFRGGDFDAKSEQLRSASRRATDPQLETKDPCRPKSIWYYSGARWLGFRIVRPLKTPSLEEMHRYWNSGPGDSE